MARYLNEAAAAADGFRFAHEAEASRFAIYQREDEGEKLVGEAHYTLLGNSGIDFDHTVVSPDLRGTGLSGILARRAVTDPIVHGREVRASCWFIDGFLAKHPELLEQRS